MFDVGRAVLHSISEAGLILPTRLLVINDHHQEMKNDFPDAVFWSPESSSENPSADFNSILLFSPKQKDENRYLTALSLKLLAKGGVFACVASNESGGKTLAKTLVGFGVPVSDYSKHKCRVVWTNEPQKAANIMIAEAEQKGGIQQRSDGLWSQPGLFSWDHLDVGTNALLHHLPFSLHGTGADFGCGIGVIGLKLLQRYKDITKLTCLDRDARALACCSKNLDQWSAKVTTRLADLTKNLDLPEQDFIVMNPPFHTGKKQSVAIGQAFIRNAAKCLKTGGILVFVANSHLPYEATAAESFAFHRILSEENGFKIIEAIK